MLPPDVGATVATGLVALSFITSALTAAVGIGGGIVLLAVMATILPPVVVLPVHGVVQLGSNAGRAAIMHAHVDRATLGFFGLGALLGAAAGAGVFVALPAPVFLLTIGLFVIYSVWAPRLRPSDMPRGGFLGVGAATTFLSMFVGGTGPFVAAFLSPEHLGRERLVATHASCMTLQHAFKVVGFGYIGFAFAEWVPLMTAMIATGFLGTLAGRQLLRRLPERWFKPVFKWVLTILAIRLLWVGTTSLLHG